MADVGSLVKKYLDENRLSKRWNFYTVLGIEELLDDRTAIALAVEAAIGSLKTADRSSDPEAFEQIVKIVRQARATLLDEEKKLAYDKQLVSSFRKASQGTPAAKQPAGELVKLQAVLPLGDPTAPFSMSEYLQQPVSELPEETAAERHFALMELARQSTTPPAAATTSPTKPPSIVQPPALDTKSGLRSGSSSAKQLQAQIRRNRQRKNMIASASVLGVGLAVIGMSVWMYFNSQKNRLNQIAVNDNQAIIGDGSSVETIDASINATSNNAGGASKKRMNLGVSDSSQSEKLGELPKLNFGGDNAENVAPIPEVSDGTMKSESQQRAMVSEDSTPNRAPMSEPAPQSPEDKKLWSESMTAARNALVDRDFKEFSDKIVIANRLSQDDTQIEKYKRLDTFGQLYEKGNAIVKEQLAKRQGGEEISVGSTLKIAVIESKEDELIIREKGQNKTYKHDQLPMGIVMSLVNLDLTSEPIDDAIRGVLFLLAPQSTPGTKSQAQPAFDKAALADPKFVGLGEVMKDTY